MTQAIMEDLALYDTHDSANDPMSVNPPTGWFAQHLVLWTLIR